MAEIQPCPHGVPPPWICSECGDTHWSPEEARRAAHVAELVALVKDDWGTFWRSLPPREMLGAAKAMPKIAGAWEQRDAQWYRPVPHEDDALLGPASWQNCGGQLWCPSLHKAGPFPDRASADAALRAADWILVDEETKPDVERTTRLAADGHWYRVDPHNPRLLRGGCTCCHPEPEEGGRG